MGGLPTSTVNGFAADPSNPKVIYVAMRDGVFSSEDAGTGWSAVSGGPKNVAAVAIHPKRPAEVYAATVEGRIFVSRDAGKTWQAMR